MAFLTVQFTTQKVSRVSREEHLGVFVSYPLIDCCVFYMERLFFKYLCLVCVCGFIQGPLLSLFYSLYCSSQTRLQQL